MARLSRIHLMHDSGLAACMAGRDPDKRDPIAPERIVADQSEVTCGACKQSRWWRGEQEEAEEQRQCKKRGYISRARALRANHWNSATVRPYRCRRCNKWHYTRMTMTEYDPQHRIVRWRKKGDGNGRDSYRD